jgi:regulator of protease activity HflC (stomatin/prohibitin superfamily)
MPDKDDTGRSGRTKTTVTWRGIVDVPEEDEPKRPGALSATGKGLNRALAAVGLARPRNEDGSRGPRRTKRLAGLVGGVVVVALLVSMGHIVQAGTVAVPETLGSAGAPLDEGFHLTAPWPLTIVSTMSVRTQNYTMTAADVPGTDDPVVVLGKDGASGAVDATLLYRLEPDRATDVYREVGTDFSGKLVQPTARSCIRSVFAGYDMVSAATVALPEVSEGITRCIADQIEPVGISVVDFQLRDVTLGADVQAAIDAKVSAQQKAESQQFEVATAERQADIARIKAGARADAAEILACGGTVETVERDGTTVDVVVPNPAESCTAPQLTSEMLQYDYIQALREIINSPNNSTIVVPEGQDLGPVLGLDPATQTPPG